MNPPFEKIGPARPEAPVIFSVPHAGREYPPHLMAMCRAAPEQLVILEDRHTDVLVADVTRQGFSGLVARTARAIIDLNRAVEDLDPTMVTPSPPHPQTLSPKARGGLGLIPRRTAGLGELWASRLTADDVEARLAAYHRPYHAALADHLNAAAARFGRALLLDIHSMPPLPSTAPGGAPQIVIGDLFGRSSAARFTEEACRIASEWGFRTARNTPYAGGYILHHHAKPRLGIHALQIEIDRRLYLDGGLREITDSHQRVASFLTSLAQQLGAILDGQEDLLAAE